VESGLKQRAPGDWGTYEQAVTWALDGGLYANETRDFLMRWREGALDEWPSYVNWLNQQPALDRNTVNGGLRDG